MEVPRNLLSPFFRFAVVNFLVNCAVNSPSLLPPYLLSLGASQTFVGLYNIVGVLLLVITVTFFGRSLVRWPRLATLRWGYAATLAAYLLSYVFAASLPALLALRVLAAASQVFASTVMVGCVFDLSPPDKRAGTLALFSVAGMLTNPVTSLVGEAVSRTWGAPALFLTGAAFALACLLWSVTLREPPRSLGEEAPQSLLQVLAKRDLWPLWGLTLGFGVYYSALTTFLPRHTELEWGEANLSAFMIPFSLVAVGIRAFLGGELDRHPPRRFLHLSFAAILVAQLLLLLPTVWPLVVLAGLVYGLGHSVLYPLLNALVVGQGDEEQRTVYSNAFVVVNLLSPVVMTPLLGLLGDFTGFRGIVTVLALVAVACFFLARRSFPKPAADPPSGRSS